MNREIKFRFYVLSEERMIDSIGFCMESSTQIRIWYYGKYKDGERMIINESFAIHDVVQMQATNLKDKNGVEIYEDDIVEHYDYSRGAFFGGSGQPKRKSKVICNTLFEGVRLPGKGFEPPLSKDVEILGNVHQNPELI